MQLNRYISSLLCGAVLATAVVTSGCAGAVAVGFNDPYYHDRHAWDNTEVGFYNRWTVETHRPANREFRRLKRNEQREYWEWRHKNH